MNRFLIVVVIAGAVIWGGGHFTGGWGRFLSSPSGPGLHVGATVDEVEKAMGRPTVVLPNFGREQRFYKAASGNKYMVTFEDGKVVEIH
jgi:hypothetical protein